MASKEPRKKKSLTEIIAARLLDDGAVAELTAAKIATDLDWVVDLSSSYLDLDREKRREIDLVLQYSGYEEIKEISQSSWVELQLAVEVKRSLNKHWVILGLRDYIDRFPDPPVRGGWTVSEYGIQLGFEPGDIDGEAYTTEAKNGWVGAGIREVFASRSGRSSSYRACIAAYKAAHWVARDWARAFGKTRVKMTDGDAQYTFPVPGHTVVVPVVLLDGLLFRATMAREEGLEVEPVSWAPVSFTYQSKAYVRPEPVIIDVVTLSAWKDYLKFLEGRVRQIAERATVLRAMLRKQMEGKKIVGLEKKT